MKNIELKRNDQCKLTLSQDQEIINHFLSNGESLKYYSKKYKVSVQTIANILNRTLKKAT